MDLLPLSFNRVANLSTELRFTLLKTDTLCVREEPAGGNKTIASYPFNRIALLARIHLCVALLATGKIVSS